MSPESFSFTPLRNLQSFNTLVLGNVPLFQTETILTAPEIILHPNANEINKMCMHCIRNCVEITKVTAGAPAPLYRWLSPQVPGPVSPQWQVAEEPESVGSAPSLAQTGLVSNWLFLCRSLNSGASRGWLLVSPPSLSTSLGVITTNPMASTLSHLRLQPRPLYDSLRPSSQLPTCSLPWDLGPGLPQVGCLQAGLPPVFPMPGSGTNSTWNPRRRPWPLCFSRLPILSLHPLVRMVGLCPQPRPPLSFSMSSVFPGCRHPSPGLLLLCVSTIHSLPQVRMFVCLFVCF